MTVALENHLGPWSERDYLALGETSDKIELIDGSLWVSPNPTLRHQHLMYLLVHELYAPAKQARLLALPDINVRLGRGRIVEPDIAVIDAVDDGLVVEAGQVKLVGEIVSPSNAGADRLLKPQLYALAGIGWYLRVEQPGDSVELHLQRLDGDRYVPHVVARPGDVLAVDEPFPFSIDVGSLLS